MTLRGLAVQSAESFLRMDRQTLRTSLALLTFLVIGLATIAPVAAENHEVLLVEIEGPVTPAMASYFERAIEAAEEDNLAAVVITLDTPGGNLDTTQAIVQTFRNARVPIIIFVGPAGAQAASAGSVITAAAHASGMAPETVIGAASPVDGSGADIEETLFRKLTEDMKATMRNLTERRGEAAVELAEAMIETARAVTSKEALEAGFIDAVASDVPDLLSQLDGLTVIVDDQPVTLATAEADLRAFDMNLVERLLHALANPLLVGILLTIGVQAILIEISSPGGWVAGFIGVLSLAMALYGLGTLPANFLGLGLIAVAFVLFLLEVKTPATGALAIVGAITLLAGFLVLFNSPGTPEFARISIWGAGAISLFTAAFFVFLVTKALQAHRRQPATGMEGLIGRAASVRSDLTAEGADADTFTGTVLIMGELWQARSGKAIMKGEQVIVTGVEGFTLLVSRDARR